MEHSKSFSVFCILANDAGIVCDNLTNNTFMYTTVYVYFLYTAYTFILIAVHILWCTAVTVFLLFGTCRFNTMSKYCMLINIKQFLMELYWVRGINLLSFFLVSVFSHLFRSMLHLCFFHLSKFPFSSVLIIKGILSCYLGFPWYPRYSSYKIAKIKVKEVFFCQATLNSLLKHLPSLCLQVLSYHPCPTSLIVLDSLAFPIANQFHEVVAKGVTCQLAQ